MRDDQRIVSGWADSLELLFLRFAAGGMVPAKWFLPEVPDEASRAARTGILKIEIVSHCWNYAHFLVYQLSTLVLFPPTRAEVTMTVFYAHEDEGTRKLLSFFHDIRVPGVIWNWQALPKEKLFRRAIGRNQAALASGADWIWFTDCDVLFRQQCIDELATLLQGRRDVLVYPNVERVTPLLTEGDPILTHGGDANYRLLDIDDAKFTEHALTRATGPMQITHGDVARACGYCNSLKFYQRPAGYWCKAHEDRAFRWLLRSRGVGLDIPNVYRIRHLYKGRYKKHPLSAGLRGNIRRLASWLRSRGSDSMYCQGA
jgi:hypothetical protein